MRYLLIALFLIPSVGCNFIDKTVVMYLVYCGQKLENGYCLGKEIPLSRRMFKVSTIRQDVIYWERKEGIDTKPRRLNDCVVRDYKNWTCQDYILAETEINIINGKFQLPKRIEGTHYVSSWGWWWVRMWAYLAII